MAVLWIVRSTTLYWVRRSTANWIFYVRIHNHTDINTFLSQWLLSYLTLVLYISHDVHAVGRNMQQLIARTKLILAHVCVLLVPLLVPLSCIYSIMNHITLLWLFATDACCLLITIVMHFIFNRLPKYLRCMLETVHTVVRPEIQQHKTGTQIHVYENSPK